MRFKQILNITAAVLLVLAAAGPLKAAEKILDRTVAFVNDDAILLSELDARYIQAKRLTPDITLGQVLQTMINRQLLLVQARKIFPEPVSEDKALQEFTDLKIRAFVRIPEQAARNFYDQNKKQLGGVPFDSVKDQIERLLKEKEINRRLQAYLETLRGNADIKIFLENTPAIFH
ncbi:MAG: hypothetical protein M0Z75_01675 [Nitrospiraceae bacterium]|nr:hypothetical protein [Nitrospiraceae bacterium]